MQQRVLIVLGMHRSGTSLAARLVNLLGVHLGDRMLHVAPDNPKGFWEHNDVFQIHERLLQSLGGREWHTTLPLPHQWWLDERVKPFRDEILSVLKRDFSDCPFWGMKDPRISRLLPFWKLILEDMHCKPYFLHVIRNPIEVAASLERRDGLSVYKSILMWFQHVTESEAETRGFPRAFITFSQLLDDWRSAVNKIAAELEIEWPIDPDNVSRDVEEFIDGSLKHHSEPDDAFQKRLEVPSYVSETYLEIVKAAQQSGHDVSDVLSRSRQNFEQAVHSYFPILGMMADLHTGAHSELKQQLNELQDQIAQKDAALAAILSSRSWRLTAPLRMITKRLRKF